MRVKPLHSLHKKVNNRLISSFWFVITEKTLEAWFIFIYIKKKMKK